MDWIIIAEKGLFGGMAALGFGILFNVPQRTLGYISILGVIGIVLKNILIGLEINIIFASFIGASTIGILSLLTARDKKSPPTVFSIPAVIPMVPGIFTYKFMLGMMRLTDASGTDFNTILSSTISNGLKATFIIMSLAVGVSFPNLIFRKQSFHVIRISKRPIKN